MVLSERLRSLWSSIWSVPGSARSTASSVEEPETGLPSTLTHHLRESSVLSARAPGGSTSRHDGTLLSFLTGDNLWDIMRDTRQLALERGEVLVIVYGGRRYGVHGEATDEALQWLMARMQQDAS